MQNFDKEEVYICNCLRWWTSIESALMDGFSCIDGVCSCDYCRYGDDWSKEEK